MKTEAEIRDVINRLYELRASSAVEYCQCLLNEVHVGRDLFLADFARNHGAIVALEEVLK